MLVSLYRQCKQGNSIRLRLERGEALSIGSMTKEEFFQRIESSTPQTLAREFLYTDTVRVFEDRSEYDKFRSRIGELISHVEFSAIVGSGNWTYSLNPEKNFREFGEHSDIDVAIISPVRFHAFWEKMRENHRRYFYGLGFDDRKRLRRNSENVYAGFVSPAWIPRQTPPERLEQKKLLNTLSNAAVGYLAVKTLFFKNPEEAVDYYSRGFALARRSIHEIRRVVANNRLD